MQQLLLLILPTYTLAASKYRTHERPEHELGVTNSSEWIHQEHRFVKIHFTHSILLRLLSCT